MPDRMHLFVRGGDDFTLAQWMNGLKRAISVALGATKKRPLWQPGFFDHILRNEESYSQKGNTCARILFVPDWLYGPTNGPIKGEFVGIDRV
jgi:hypothetical protein